MDFDWNTTEPLFDKIIARELYNHTGDIGDETCGENYEYENLATQPEHQGTISKLHEQLVKVVKKGLVKPITD